jgi:two-component system sensor histidine kinase SenX3
VSPTTEAVVLALLGVVLGAGIVLAWRISEAKLRPAADAPAPGAAVPPGVASVLAVLPSSALVVEPDLGVLKASAPAYAMGLVREGIVVVDELSELVRQVRRDGQIREARVAVGSPARQVWVRAAPLGAKLVLVLAEDRTREDRVEEIRRDFVANVSHELKTPVGALSLLAEGVLDAADDPEAVRRFAHLMRSEGERLATLVSRIIELSRLQDDEVIGDAAPVPIDELLERCLAENAVEAAGHGVALQQGGEGGLAVHGNEEQLALAVGNLVANAVSYSSQGSRVAVSAHAVADRVEVSVADEGIGIPEEEQARIFERFYRLDPARQRSTGGTGLGLSIVKHVAASHGGDVRVQSAPGLGSTFVLSLPAEAMPIAARGPG